ncbi:hypothetical protein E3E22_05790 [Thermococcus sp. MV5]|uniref:hypothetical protein n=1 Tax=Thermococcus sp. MV5 TaxID=1638272 RepID=UPI001438D3CF|nr:hypothetical protein [Thermococcus sp. MV5]NJE26139.1 hypothetical protein [Thermococcus sp. MV5]
MEVAVRYFGTAVFLLILAVYSLIYLKPSSVEFYVLIISIIMTSIVLILALKEIFKYRETVEIKK